MIKMRQNLSIRTKLVIIYVPIIILTVFVCFMGFINLLEKRMIGEFGTGKIVSLKHIADKNNYMIENTIYISNSYLFNSAVKDYVDMQSTVSTYEKSKIYEIAERSLQDNKNIFFNLEYFTTFLGIGNSNYITTSSKADIETDKERRNYIQSIIGDDITSLRWSPAYFYLGEPIISAARYLSDVNTGEQIGIMIFDFPESVFSRAYDKYLESGENIAVVRGDGNVVSSSKKEILGRSIDSTATYEEIQGFKEGYFYSKEEQAIITFYKMDVINWYVVSSTPVTTVLAPFHDVQQKLILILAVITLIFLGLTLIAARYVAGPLVNLANEIKLYHGVKEEDKRRIQKNEVSYLHGEYQKMTERIEQLIGQIMKEQEEKRISEIEALQAQINPHFLYNTLQSVRNLNRIGDRDSIDKVIISLVRLLSAMLHNKEKVHTIREEVQFLNDYIYIQKVRYGHNFDVIYNYSKEVTSFVIPKLILQPIVENAVFHGLSGYTEGGKLFISIKEAKGTIIIIVADNGVGFDEVELKNSENKPKVTNGIAIKNIKNRLKLFYGERAGIEIIGKKMEGTIVTIRIPALKTDEEKTDEDNDCR